MSLLLKSTFRFGAKTEGFENMPRENDLEGPQDMGGKHGGQKGMPKPEPRPQHESKKDGDVVKKAPEQK